MSVGLLKKNIYNYSERVLKYSTLQLRISVRKHLRKNYFPVLHRLFEIVEEEGILLNCFY